MKYCFLIIIVFWISGNSTYANSANTFQLIVVGGDVRLVSNNQTVNALSYVPGSETLRINDDAYVALIDILGNVYEYYGRKEIFLDTLRGKLISVPEVPPIEMLYSSSRPPSHILGEKEGQISLFFPFLFAINMYIGDSVKLVWKDDLATLKKFRLSLTDEYGEKVIEEKVDEMQHVIFFNMRHKSYKKLMVCVEEIGTRRKSLTKAISFVNESIRLHDVTCDINTAAGCLMLAFYLEDLGYKDDVLGYYDQASKLAPGVSQYSRFVTLFKDRWK